MKTKNTIFTGFHITPEMDLCIRMNAMARNIPVAQILRNLVEEWVEDEQLSQKKLIIGIVGRIATDYSILSLKTEVDNDKFLSKWRGVLSKKLATPLVNKIIREYEASSPNPQ